MQGGAIGETLRTGWRWGPQGRTMDGEPKTAQLLADWRGGAVDARNALIARLHPELSVIAARAFAPNAERRFPPAI